MKTKLVLAICTLCGMLDTAWGSESEFPIKYRGFGTHDFLESGTVGQIYNATTAVIKNITFDGKGDARWIYTIEQLTTQFPNIKYYLILTSDKFNGSAIGKMKEENMTLSLPLDLSKSSYIGLYSLEKRETIGWAKVVWPASWEWDVPGKASGTLDIVSLLVILTVHCSWALIGLK